MHSCHKCVGESMYIRELQVMNIIDTTLYMHMLSVQWIPLTSKTACSPSKEVQHACQIVCHLLQSFLLASGSPLLQYTCVELHGYRVKGV